MKKVLRREGGFTIVEGLVVLVITGLLITFAARFFILQNKECYVQGEISFLQKDIRLAMETLESEIRMAGSGFPRGIMTSSITIMNAEEGPDELVLMQTVPGVRCLLTQTMPDQSAELQCDNTAGFAPGWALIADEVGSELFLITQVEDNLNRLQHDSMTLSRAYQAASRVMQARLSQFLVDAGTAATGSAEGRSRLVRREYDGTEHIVAEDIEDIQYVYILKDHSETTVMPADPNDLVMVRVTVIGRTAKSDADFTGDGYRRRELVTRVQLRNFNLRNGI